jgi:hypothetical protein
MKLSGHGLGNIPRGGTWSRSVSQNLTVRRQYAHVVGRFFFLLAILEADNTALGHRSLQETRNCRSRRGMKK